MMRFVLLFLLIPHIRTGLYGQNSHLLRCDVLALAAKNLGLSYEFRPNAKSGFELQFRYKNYNEVTSQVFNGDWINTYAQKRTDYYVTWSTKSDVPGAWVYIDDNRPLPEMPPLLSNYNIYFKVGYSIVMSSKNGRWSLLLQPGIFATRHQYFTISDRLDVLGDYKRSWSVATNTVNVERSVYYRQVRSMRLHNKVVSGLAYDVGISQMLGRRVQLEIRGAFGMSLSKASGEMLPAPANRFFGLYSVNLGYVFGA